MALCVGIIIGLVLGLTGAGGSVFAVPLLMFLIGLPAQQAVGISLGAVAVSALFGMLTHMRSGQIQWFSAFVYALLGGVFAPLGGWLGRLVDESVLMLGFACLVALVAARMWKQAKAAPQETRILRAKSPPQTDEPGGAFNNSQDRPFSSGLPNLFGISVGAGVTGLLSGLFGVGGGFLIVPTLLYLTGINMKQAVATSLFIISVISTSGFLSFLLIGNNISTAILGWVALGGMIGMAAGIAASNKIAGPTLQKTFAVMMGITAFLVTLKQY